jgi:hypothetical protein
VSRTFNFGQNTIATDRYDASDTVNIPNTRLVLIGRFERGPVGVPTICTDADDLIAKFGAGDPLIGTDRLVTDMQNYKKNVGNAGDALVLRLFEGAGGTAAEPAGAAKVRASAYSAGLYGNNLQRAFVTRTANGGTQVDAYVREVVNGITRRNTSTTFMLTAAGIAQANLDLAGLLHLTYDGVATAATVDGTIDGAALVWTSLTGGLDSASVTVGTLTGQIDPTTQERSGLFTLRDTQYGAPIVITEGFTTDPTRLALYQYTADQAGIYLDASPTDLLPGAAITEKQHLESLLNAECVYYIYPRARVSRSLNSVTTSALGYIAGNLVRGANQNPGNVSPPTGPTSIPDVQRAPNGRDQLVHSANAATLEKIGMGLLRLNGNAVSLTGEQLVIPDPVQPATDKAYERLIMAVLIYSIGPALSQYDNVYVDAKGVFYNVVRGRIREILRPFWVNGVLYGATIDDAFDIKMDFELNSPESVSKTGRAKARVKVKISPVNEGIDLSIFNIPITAGF